MLTLTLFQKYYALVESIRMDHEQNRERIPGHDLLHALMVAQYTLLIAEDAEEAELAWIAALLHNTDRILTDPSQTELVVQTHLHSLINLTREHKDLIVEAVLKHDKRNDPSDHPVIVILKDADRLTNIGPTNILRIGQGYRHLPAVDPIHFAHDPNASYADLRSAYRNVAELLVWEDWLRLPKAKELAKPYFQFLKSFMNLLEYQYVETGLKPYTLPFSSV